jgi:hypothetical protein
MKHSPFNNLKIYRYFFIAFILILGILAFYVSCKSKSPTDANAASSDALAAQGAKSTTQTTTSSSTTTSVKPGQSPTNTTTLITSRNLTTTSTRTTTSSSSTTSTTTTSRKPTPPTTTSRKPTTTVPTTSVGVCNLEWCEVTVTINSDPAIVAQHHSYIYVFQGDVVKISLSVKNSGTAATNASTYAYASPNSSPPGSFIYMDTEEDLGAIPADNTCYTWQDALQINVSSDASFNDMSAVDIYITAAGCSGINIYFTLVCAGYTP